MVLAAAFFAVAGMEGVRVYIHIEYIEYIRGVALRVEIDLAESGHSRPLAATRSDLSGAATCGHLRPLAATWEERPLAATCGHLGGAATRGHLRPLEWLRVAANGRRG